MAINQMNIGKNIFTNSKFNSTKIIAGIFTFAILTLLIFAGPAKAFILELIIVDDSQVDKGETIKFIATLDIEDMDEYLPIKNLTLILDGPINKQCVFDISGNPISGCEGLTISKIDSSSGYGGYGYGYGYDNSYGYGYGYSFDYGYGYGYNYGAGGGEVHLEYEMVLDTQYYSPGEYETALEALIGDKTFSKSGENIIINDDVDNGYTPSGGSSGGDTTYWECGEWSECINETQERVCEDIFGTKLNRTETKTCFPSFIPSGQGNETGDININEEGQTTNFLTGAVTGIGNFAKSGGGILTLSILVLVGGAVFIVLLKKRFAKKLSGETEPLYWNSYTYNHGY